MKQRIFTRGKGSKASQVYFLLIPSLYEHWVWQALTVNKQDVCLWWKSSQWLLEISAFLRCVRASGNIAETDTVIKNLVERNVKDSFMFKPSQQLMIILSTLDKFFTISSNTWTEEHQLREERSRLKLSERKYFSAHQVTQLQKRLLPFAKRNKAQVSPAMLSQAKGL